MKFIETIQEGSECPRLYGLAWRSFIKPECYCAPIPFNHIIRVSRQIWHRIKYPMYFACSSALLEEYTQHKIALAEAKCENIRLKASVKRLKYELE